MSLKEQLLNLVSRYAAGGRVGRDEGGSVSTSDILRDMSASDMTRDISPGPDVRRRMQDQAMRGVEASPLQREQLRMYLADMDRRREIKSREIDEGAVGSAIAKTLAPPIPGWNFPSFEESSAELGRRTSDNAARRGGMSEGERLLDLAKEYAMEAGPYAAPAIAQKGAPMVAAVMRNIPKSAYAGVPLAGGLLTPSQAGDKSNEDPRMLEMRQKETEIERLRNELRKMGTINFQSTVAREKASEPYLQGIAAAQRRIDQINMDMRHDSLKASTEADVERKRIIGEAADKRDAVLNEAPKPFSRAWPTAAEWWPYAPMIAAGLTSAGLGLKRGLSERNAAQSWEGAIDRAASPTRKAPGRETAAMEAEKIAESWPAKGAMSSGLSKFGDYGGPAMLGATEGAFIPHLPYFYNALKLDKENPERASMQTYYRNLPEGDPEAQRVKRLLDDPSALPRGNPAKEEAIEYFKDPSSMLMRTGIGAGEGAAATLPGTTLGKMVAPGKKELDVLRARTDALRSGRGTSDIPEGGQTGGTSSPPPSPAPLPLASTPPRAALPPPLPETVRKAPEATPAPETAISATVTSGPPKLPKGYFWNDKGVGSKIHGPNGQFTTMDLVNPKTKARKSKKGEPGEDTPSAGQINGHDVPKKPDRMPSEDDPGFRANGGKVLALAKKYADGGSVISHGLVHGDTPGRADALDVEVPNGAYILSADVVSALGDGNTMAGSKRFREQSPAPHAGYKDGGTVPIMISDGEEVVHPAVVMAYGAGDLQQGHRILDAFSKKIRQENIAKLKSLPPPATS